MTEPDSAATPAHNPSYDPAQPAGSGGSLNPAKRRLNCGWAPFGHGIGEARYRMKIERPCGHGSTWEPACEPCTLERRAYPQASKATTCLICGDLNQLRIVRVTDL